MVISVATLHHLAEPQTIRRAIREMFRLVRPGGFLVLWDHNPWNPYWKILMRRVPQDVGTERLIRRKEVISALDDLRAELSQRDVWHLGFVPDFVPRRLLRAAARLEAFLEKLPLVRLFSAHTVFVFRRRSLLPHVA
jgi:SAM-dependent methyltransferase